MRVQRVGRKASFEAFFAAEWHAVRRVALRLSGNRAFAEDAAQEAMLQAWKEWDRIERYDVPSLWVRRVALNRTVSHLRRKTPVVTVALAYEDPEPTLCDEPVFLALRSLPVHQAAAIVLYYLEDMATTDVAAVMNRSEVAIRQLLSRGRERLRVELATETVERG